MFLCELHFSLIYFISFHFAQCNEAAKTRPDSVVGKGVLWKGRGEGGLPSARAGHPGSG